MKDSLAPGTLKFEHVSKRYRIGSVATLRNAVSDWLAREHKNEQNILWALRNVSFDLKQGEALALIGPNGSGKTTTLKLLSRVTRPTEGTIAVGGRISSLIELGAGFHPELTGRENIYLNGAILGLKRHEIKARLDAIVAFSELERFLDTPVKRYSSGMYVRLGFAVAAHVEPDVLLVDEVLAVGDATFRQRCIQRMSDLRRNGTTLLFVSHNMHLVRNVCENALLLYRGEAKAAGPAHDVIGAYEKLIASSAGDRFDAGDRTARIAETEGTNLLLSEIEVAGSTDEANMLDSQGPATIRIHYRAHRPQQIGRLLVMILREDGAICSAVDATQAVSDAWDQAELSQQGVISVTYEPLQLASGAYFASVTVTEVSDNIVIASGQSARFDVVGNGTNMGIYIPCVRLDSYTT